MKRPACDYNFTAIPNEILDELCRRRITGEDRQVLDLIMRETYGWGKREAEIEPIYFMSKTGMIKQNVFRALKRLESRNIIIVSIPAYGKGKKYKINSDFTKWKSLAIPLTAAERKNVSNPAYESKHPRLQTVSSPLTKVSIPAYDDNGKSTTDKALPVPKEIKEIYKENKESGVGLSDPLEGQSPPPSKGNGKRHIPSFETKPIPRLQTPLEREEKRRELQLQAAFLMKNEAASQHDEFGIMEGI